ncbi:hypothetical protein AB1M95_02190 [Sulfitobacter sp. LCG007]
MPKPLTANQQKKTRERNLPYLACRRPSPCPRQGKKIYACRKEIIAAPMTFMAGMAVPQHTYSASRPSDLPLGFPVV